MKAVNILWDLDEEDRRNGVDLPTEIEILADIDPDDDDAISDYLSDVTGFCHNGFNLEE